MKYLIVTSTNAVDKTDQLVRSLKHWGYDYHIIEHQWNGFLDKLHRTYEYLKEVKDYTHFIYTDAWDTFALKADLPIINGFLISAERNCYPYAELADKYPDVSSPFKYVNGGGWGGEISAFLKLYESLVPTNEMNDQVWLTERYLHFKDSDWVKLDVNCEVFQTIGFCEEERDFNLTQGLNKITNTYPVFWHGNGHTPMKNIYNLI